MTTAPAGTRSSAYSRGFADTPGAPEPCSSADTRGSTDAGRTTQSARAPIPAATVVSTGTDLTTAAYARTRCALVAAGATMSAADAGVDAIALTLGGTSDALAGAADAFA